MNKKVFGLIVLLISYIISIGFGVGTYFILKEFINNIYLNIFLCNVVSTIIIWLIGNIFKTASIYDPYWSVQTVVIAIFLMIIYKSVNFGSIIYLSFVLIWAIRLTVNFIKTFNDLSYIDWRYKMLKEKTKIFYPFVNLLGIHMVPTVIVYVASLPLFVFIVEGLMFNPLMFIGLIIMLSATLLEFKADKDMHKFIANRKDRSQIIREGIWKNSRHPNYLGEISFWYGVYIVLLITMPSYWYLGIGAILNTLLFLFISIPLAENHMAQYKENYSQYKKEVRMLLPFKK